MGLEYRFIPEREYESYEDFLTKNDGAELYFFTAKGEICYTDIDYPEGSFLVFGRESVGLPDDLVSANFARAVRVPMLSGARCLNLSNTVAVAAYEVLRQWGYPALSGEGRLRNYTWKD